MVEMLQGLQGLQVLQVQVLWKALRLLLGTVEAVVEAVVVAAIPTFIIACSAEDALLKMDVMVAWIIH